MVQVSYPGVYIQEVPSGVRTITGVPTSITAFIGRAASGPTDDPAVINSWADYERRFGGLAVDSTMSYAVRDFYLNSGSQAVIVRVAPDNAAAATITLDGFGSPFQNLVLEASSVGEWGNRLRASVDHGTDSLIGATSPPDTTRFNLFVQYQVAPDRDQMVEERFLNVSTNDDDPRYLPRVLENQSTLVRVHEDPPESGRLMMPAERPESSITQTSPPTRPVTMWTQAVGGGDGGDLQDKDILGSESDRMGIYALLKTDIFNLLSIPPRIRGNPGDPGTWTSADVYQKALALCTARRAFLIVDPDPAWGTRDATAVSNAISGRDSLGLAGTAARNAALYFPCVKQVDPLRDNQVYDFVPSGIVAGIISRTDSARGVWKAPAGLDAALNGVQGLQVNLSDLDNGQLNPLGINCLRSFPVNGRVVWGSRTLRGADQAADEYKYVPVRRLALYIEESLYRGTQWVVFEPNDEPLWAQIRLNVGAFMQNLFQQGAFQGRSPREAYLVKCDAETTTQNDINLGIVNILVGFAPLKPAEFVIIRIQQLAGQVQA
jgi:hypothetical protein